jgi:class 3 adenylate cyclase
MAKLKPTATRPDVFRLLNALQELESAYTMFILSGGPFGAKECKHWAEVVLARFDALFEIDKTSKQPEGNDGESWVYFVVRRMLDSGDLEKERATQPYFAWTELYRPAVRRWCQQQLGIAEQGELASDYFDAARARQMHVDVQGRPHFPPQVFTGGEPSSHLIAQMSESDTIVVYADLRHSQQMMLYSDERANFAERLLGLIEETRQLVVGVGGVFDKFTGDGLVCYFSPPVFNEVAMHAQLAKHGYATPTGNHAATLCQPLVMFLRGFTTIVDRHIAEWSSTLATVPCGGLGVGIGADIGQVRHESRAGYMVSIGLPIVLAARLCSAAKAGETLINHRLKVLLERSGTLACTKESPMTVTMKSGEAIEAYAMTGWDAFYNERGIADPPRELPDIDLSDEQTGASHG